MTADSPKVTVVIPAYNMQRFVERALLSAANQTYANLDILAIDDGSTDRTPEIVADFARQRGNVRVVTTANTGVAAARNLGIELAASPYVAFLDADDLWAPRKIEKQVASLAEHGFAEEWAGSYTLYRMVDEFDRVIGNGALAGERGDFFQEHLSWNPVGNGSSLLVRRDAALAVGGFNPEYAARGIGGCEDLEFQLKLLRRYKIELVREYTVGYRIHPAQMSGDIVRMRLGRLAVIENIAAISPDSASWRRRVMTDADLAAAQAYFIIGDWRGTARWGIRALALSPYEVAMKLWRICRRDLQHFVQRIGDGHRWRTSSEEPSRPFEQFDTTDDVEGDATRVRYLAPLLAAARARGRLADQPARRAANSSTNQAQVSASPSGTEVAAE